MLVFDILVPLLALDRVGIFTHLVFRNTVFEFTPVLNTLRRHAKLLKLLLNLHLVDIDFCQWLLLFSSSLRLAECRWIRHSGLKIDNLLFALIILLWLVLYLLGVRVEMVKFIKPVKGLFLHSLALATGHFTIQTFFKRCTFLSEFLAVLGELGIIIFLESDIFSTLFLLDSVFLDDPALELIDLTGL